MKITLVAIVLLSLQFAGMALYYWVQCKELKEQNRLLRRKVRLHEQLEAQRQLMMPQRSVYFPEIFWN